ncbi:MAG: hypothetical protein ACUZ8I_07705 [Candidatus Scalindua sp.]
MDDFLFYAPRCLKVINESGQLVPLDLSCVQLYVHGLLEAQLKKKGYIRARILKARKMWISTLIEGRFYWKVSHRKGVSAKIMTEADESRDNLFRMVKTYHDFMLPELKPSTIADSLKALVFDDEDGKGLKSRYDVKTCDSKGGKGMTSHYNHWSEAAYFSQAALDNLSGLMESIPSKYPGILGTEKIDETTANGASGYFYDGWQETKNILKDGGEPEYINIFAPWTFDKGYTLRVTVEQAREIMATLTDEEKWLLHFINPDNTEVNVGNLAWRRWKIKNVIAPLGFSKEDIFKQWYPITDDEAFIYSGKSIFSVSDIKMAELECYKPEIVGDFNYYGKFIARQDGELKIWQKPRINRRYAIGADIAEGIAGDKWDYSTADVIDCMTGQQVAHICCKLDPDRFGEFLNHLGRYYNNALLGVEANNHGLTTITTLKHKSYPKIYQREMLDARGTGRKMKKAGWLTTSKSKHKIIDQLYAIVRDRDTGIVNIETLAEFRNYTVLENTGDTGKILYGGKPGCHDDRVMSYAIAVEMYMTMPSMRIAKEKRVRNITRTGTGTDELSLKEAVVSK